MMLFSKAVISYALVGVLLSFSFPVSAATPVTPTQNAGKMPTRVDRKVGTIKRVTEFMIKVEGGVLYTENNRYNLSGVKILDRSKDNQMTPTIQSEKKIVEMIFFDDRLQQVLIHR